MKRLELNQMEMVEGGRCSDSTMLKLLGMGMGAGIIGMTIWAGPLAAPVLYASTVALYACIFQ